jgi:hypothetical protein
LRCNLVFCFLFLHMAASGTGTSEPEGVWATLSEFIGDVKVHGSRSAGLEVPMPASAATDAIGRLLEVYPLSALFELLRGATIAGNSDHVSGGVASGLRRVATEQQGGPWGLPCTVVRAGVGDRGVAPMPLPMDGRSEKFHGLWLFSSRVGRRVLSCVVPAAYVLLVFLLLPLCGFGRAGHGLCVPRDCDECPSPAAATCAGCFGGA